MGKKLSDSLTQFLSSDSFDNPYDTNEKEKIDIDSFIEDQKEKKKSKPKKKKDKFVKVMERSMALTDSFDLDDSIDDFEGYLEDFLLDDEDAELRRELIKRGRQYTRDTSLSRESSEIEKIYSGNQQRIEKLLKEVESDNDSLQKDITNMRASRSRNYKTLAELVEQRRSLHDTTLRAINELNKMNKDKIELQMKVDKVKGEEGGDQELIANRALQNIFGMGRDALIGSYEDVSGSSEAGMDDSTDSYNEDEIIHNKYFSDEDEKPETDGDKFLKYEGLGAHYILEYDDDGPIQIVAEDRDGNVLPDYPTPELSDDLQFTISENTGTATDSLAQKYDLRKI